MGETRMKVLIAITWRTKYHWDKGHLACLSYNELENVIIRIVEKLERENCDPENGGINIKQYTNKELALELWRRFNDVTINPKTECIEEEWNNFDYCTPKEEIVRWFGYTFNVDVASLMKVR